MTITHSTFQFEMDDIIREIKELSKNFYIEEYVNVPEPSIIRLKLLNLSLFHASVPQHLRKVYCVTAGLIQLGLDVHETISNQKENTEKGIRNRQLSILAGDYYSSKYYSLLAKYGLIDGIKKLANAIKNINIAKMKLYTNNSGNGFESVNQLLELIKIRESNLYIQFISNKIKSEKQRIFWYEIIEDMILLFTLINELKTNHVEQHDFSFLLTEHLLNREEKKDIKEILLQSDMNNIKLKKLYRKYDIQRKLEDIVQKLYNDLLMKVDQVENRTVYSELDYLLSQFSNNFHILNYNIAPANI